MIGAERLPSSFRDPSGFVFRADGAVWRQINRVYADDWRLLEASGLLVDLFDRGLLVRHEPAALSLAASDEALLVVKPEQLPFVSYPYEWCFSQLKDAALLTLEIQRSALVRGMSLKDATAYNVQFVQGQATFIDTLSFEAYPVDRPWVAYRQFCSHFLAPLALMALVDIRLAGLQRIYTNGIPLDLAARLLPATSKIRPGLAAHIHLHARAQRVDGRGDAPSTRKANVSRTGLLALIDSLQGTIESLKWEPKSTQWSEYYSETNYTEASMAQKRELVGEFLDAVTPTRRECWDLGANTGEFSALAAERGFFTIAADSDPAAVEKAYIKFRASRNGSILPLLIDLANPSPDQGWANSERDSLLARGPAGVVMGLALVHHLAIGENVPLSLITRLFSQYGEWAIVEFVPKSDSQVARLLRSREDVFPDYDEPGFESAAREYFDIVRAAPIPGTTRTLYLLRRL